MKLYTHTMVGYGKFLNLVAGVRDACPINVRELSTEEF